MKSDIRKWFLNNQTCPKCGSGQIWQIEKFSTKGVDYYVQCYKKNKRAEEKNCDFFAKLNFKADK